MVATHVENALQLMCAQDHYAALVLQHAWKEYRHRCIEKRWVQNTKTHLALKENSTEILAQLIKEKDQRQIEDNFVVQAEKFSKQMRTAFRVFDLDNDGLLENNEVRSARCFNGNAEMTAEAYERLYAKYDKHESGT